MRLKLIYTMVAFGCAAALVGCSDGEFAGVSETGSAPETVAVTLTASRPSGAHTRTLLQENTTGGLKSTWSEGDKLLVVASDGTKAGELTLQTGENSTEGVFSGELQITDGTKARVWYLGANNGDDAPYTSAAVSSDGKVAALTTDLRTNFGGTFDDLKRADLLTKENVVFTVKGGKGYVQNERVELSAMMAMAHFTLKFPDDFVPSGEATLTVNSEDGDLPSKKVWNPLTPDGNTSSENASYGYSLTLGSEASGIVLQNNRADVYLPIVPGSYKLKFDVVAGGKQYTCSLKNKSTIEGGYYYTSGESSESSSTFDGILVSLVEVSQPDAEVVGPEFTITDRNGKTVKVRFTRANLHYRTADDMWYIPEKQTAQVNMAGRSRTYNGSYSGAGSLDLFRWGATGFKDARREVVSPETEVNTSGSNLTGSYLPYISDGTSLSVQNGQRNMRNAADKYIDWGWVYGYQENGKSSYEFPDIYYTLSPTEWNKIVTDYIHVCATVEDVPGLLLLDCNNDEEARTLLKKYNAISADSDYIRVSISNFSNKKTSFKWNNIIIEDYNVLEKLNAVFFPRTGSQLPGNSVYKDQLRYWESESKSTTAYNLWMRLYSESTSCDFKTNDSECPKSRACAVRLVKVVESVKDDTTVGGDL